MVKQPWKPSLTKYWPYSFREFIKTMLMIYNRKNSLQLLSKDSLYSIIRMLHRNAFSDNILSKLNSKDNKTSSSLQVTKNIIYDVCTVCGKLTKNRCATCRKQGIEIRYCGIKCIEYDWDYHKKLHM
jgi:predicted RNA-binding Zn-ribbon protein involved in translation (DUF1610 family)